jgi:hypothetical protein
MGEGTTIWEPLFIDEAKKHREVAVFKRDEVNGRNWGLNGKFIWDFEFWILD